MLIITQTGVQLQPSIAIDFSESKYNSAERFTFFGNFIIFTDRNSVWKSDITVLIESLI